MRSNNLARLLAVSIVLVSPLASGVGNANPLMDGTAPQAALFSLSTYTGTGILYGEAREYVYDAGTMISELVWPMKPLFYWQAGVNIKNGFGLYANLDLKSGFDAFSGVMTDSDFLNYDGVKTHFSAHNCRTERALFLDASIGYAYQVISSLTIGADLDLSMMRFSWTAGDGYLQYGTKLPSGYYTPWNEDITKIPVYGTGIAYTQSYILPGIGLRIDYLALPSLRFRIACVYSPLLACDDLDNHFLRFTAYVEKMRQGTYLRPELLVEYELSKSLSLRIAAVVDLAMDLVGDTTATGTGVTKSGDLAPGVSAIYADGGGAGLTLLDLSLGINLRL